MEKMIGINKDIGFLSGHGSHSLGPDRFAMIGCLPATSAEIAAQELRRCADLGLSGGELPLVKDNLPFWKDEWEPYFSNKPINERILWKRFNILMKKLSNEFGFYQ